MGEGALRKDFIIPAGEWSEDHAETIESFFEELVTRHVTLKTGTYVGTARVQTVPVSDLPGPPKLLCIQPALGGTVVLTIVPYSSGNVTAWTNKGFTLSTAAGVNTANTSYKFLILA